MKKSMLIYCGLLLAVVILFVVVIMYLVVLFPLRYKDTIKKYSDIYRLEPEVVCAIINIESGFDNRAESRVGARGLMQIMPSTATEIAEKLNINNFTLDMLYSPDINIRIGCYYLSYLKGMYGNNLNNVVASYNAGFNKVNEWLTNSEYSKDGVITNPPINETRDYINKFKLNLRVYKSRF